MSETETAEVKTRKPREAKEEYNLIPLIQELCHFTGQERLLDKHGIPRMGDAHKINPRKK